MAAWQTLRVVSCIAAVAASGCGGGDPPEDERMSKADYQAAIFGVAEDSTEPTKLFTDLVVESRPRDECAAMVTTFERQVGGLVERVADLRPPARVQSIHDDFVASARMSVDRVGEVRDRVAAGDVSCGPELNRELYRMPSSNQADRAIARLQKHGYFVSGE